MSRSESPYRKRRRNQADPYKWWLAQHGAKRIYRNRLRAWLAIARICIADREVISRRHGHARFLVPYDCTWTDRWEAGRHGPSHVHIGHQSWRGSRARSRLHSIVIWPWHRRVVWPLYRARSRWRRYRKAHHQPFPR